jgi:hypothetical protein
MSASRSAITPISADVAIVPDSVLELRLETQQRKQELLALAMAGAPLTDQILVMQEIERIGEIEIVAEAGIAEIAHLTDEAQRQAARVALMGQVLVNGMRGMVDEAAVAKVDEIRFTGLEGISLTHVAGVAGMHDRVAGYKPRDGRVGLRDVAHRLLTATTPGALARRSGRG